MKKTKDWPAHHDYKERIDLIKDIISPFDKLLDAKSKCQTENMRHRIGQTINRPRMTDGVLAVYDGLKANLLRYKNTSAGDLNKIVDKMPDVDFKCWLDEVGRCLNDFCRLIIESKQQLDLSVLQKYSDMCFFYYTELKELAETDDEIPFYMAPTEMVNSLPKKVEHHKKTKEIVYDDVGLHRIKTISAEPQDPNMPDNAKIKGGI